MRTAFTWMGKSDVVITAHRRLPADSIVLPLGNLTVDTCADLRTFTGAQPQQCVLRLPACAPDVNLGEGKWSALQREVLASLAVVSFAHLVQAIRRGPEKIQRQPGLMDRFLAGTALTLKRR